MNASLRSNIQLVTVVAIGKKDMTGAYTASFLPIVFVPLICMVVFAVVLGLLFVYIESEA